MRDWVYLSPEAPRSREKEKRQESGRCGQSEPAYANGLPEGELHPGWTRGKKHVQEWAEFLWRVSRPGILVDFSSVPEGGEGRRRGCGARGGCGPKEGRRRGCSAGGGGGCRANSCSRPV